MNLLLATDHKFLLHEGRVYDRFGFDRGFFEDYGAVFDQVRVAARLEETESVPAGAGRSCGDGVDFLREIWSAHGMRWVGLAGIRNRRVLQDAAADCGAVIVRVPSQLGILAARLARQQGIPLLTEVIGDPETALRNAGNHFAYEMIAKFEAARMTSIIEHSQLVSYVSISHLQMKYPAPPGVDQASISSIRLNPEWISSARRYRAGNGPIRVVYVASLIPYKRHADLIHAGAKLKQSGIDLELHFIGGGPLRESLVALSRDNGMLDKVTFHGHISNRSRLRDALDLGDLFVIPSATEGLPRAVIEAMARGLPVLGSEAGGIPELVRGEDLFPVGDVEQLTRLLEQAALNPERLRKMSAHSISTAQNYSEDRLSPRRREIYFKLQAIASRK